MARIRTIKPEFFTSEDIVALSPLARLLYIGLWCEADREGRMLWKPRTFKMRYFPADQCDIEALCLEVLNAGLVKLYGDGLAFIPQFGRHQHVNPRESKSELPDPTTKLTRQPRVATRHSPDSDAQVGREGKEGEDDASSIFDLDPSPDDPAPHPIATIPLVDGSEFEVLPSKAAEWSAAFPAVDVPQKLMAIRAWCNANPSRRKTRRGVETFIVGWLGKDQDSGRGPKPPPVSDTLGRFQ